MSAALRVLVLVQGTLGERLAGPEIRGWEIAKAFAGSHDVTVAAGVDAPCPREGIPVVPRTRRSIVAEVRRADVIIAPVIPPYAFLANPRCLRVADLYDPVELEIGTLPGARARRDAQSRRIGRGIHLERSDVVLGANRRQLARARNDHAALRRRAPAPSMLMVPMGLPAAPGPPAGHPIRERFPEIGPDDPVVLWWGNVWRWLDADTAVDAVELLARDRPDVRLVITAGRPANAATDSLNVTEEVRARATARGLVGRTVFFLDEWVPFERRGDYLADADVGIAMHADTPEAALAARARYMDYVWASLPSVLAAGDEVGDELAQAGAAVLVPPGDAEAAAAALGSLLFEPGRLGVAREACRDVADAYRWEALLAPLVDLVEARGHDAARLRRGDRLGVARQAGGYYARRVVDRALAPLSR